MSLPEPSPEETHETPEPIAAPRKFPVVAIIISVLLLLIVVGAGGTLYYLRWARQPASTKAAPVRITIPPGSTVESVAKDLETRHVIRSARVFTMTAKEAKIQPGIYDLSASESVNALVRRLESGDVVKVRVTFPEGFTVKQMAKRLARNGLCDENEFYTLVTEHGDTLTSPLPKTKNLEGYLFPDTYRFPLGSNAKEIAEHMLGDFALVFGKTYEDDIKKSGHSLAEIVTVASLVEREAETDGDRPLIAGVIYNRINRGMRLQIDATVQYVLPEHKTRLLYKDLEVASPYNTYKIIGLPPGAICCPGKPSLLAALHPATHDYLFYVAGPGRAHIFTKTFKEHTQAINSVRHAR